MITRSRSGERGQTIVLVALSIVSLLAMGALAIDVVTLYTARSEIQRAADAAALAGAKACVDSGSTSDPNNASLQILARSMGTSFINAILAENKVGGVPPVLLGTPVYDFTTHPGNPQITVTLQRTGLPIFFARMWSRAAPTVTALANAETYNASNSQTNTGNLVPISPKCVKPFLIPNRDPLDNLPFVNTTTGQVRARLPGFVGEAIALNLGCKNVPNNSCVVNPNPPAAGSYVPALVPANSANLCPACSVGAPTNYEQIIGCCSQTSILVPPDSCGATTPNATVDFTINPGPPGNETQNGVQCLTHKPSHDTLDTSMFPTGPMQISAGSGPQSGKLVTTSSSIVTMPIFDDSLPIPPSGQVTVVGFLQAFINDAPGSGTINVTILNVVGCGNNPGAGAPVSAGGISPIPVRLIHH